MKQELNENLNHFYGKVADLILHARKSIAKKHEFDNVLHLF